MPFPEFVKKEQLPFANVANGALPLADAVKAIHAAVELAVEAAVAKLGVEAEFSHKVTLDGEKYWMESNQVA